jgi:hypothetical protein
VGKQEILWQKGDLFPLTSFRQISKESYEKRHRESRNYEDKKAGFAYKIGRSAYSAQIRTIFIAKREISTA